jgi:hypothetical protein
MKLAIGYSTKDQVELTEQTFPVLRDGQHALFWCDASRDAHALRYFDKYKNLSEYATIRGGADSAIAWKLSTLLASPANFTHIGLMENDVLLDPDWLAPTLELFEKGKADGLSIGAVSPRSYVDRVLIQRDGYAVMHNIGAGAIIFTRDAAEVILKTFRTAWWPDTVRLFAMLSGIDLRTYAAFRGNEQWTTTDWQFEAQLARHGLAALALTPAKCQMIGQVPSLEQQGLSLTKDSGTWTTDPGPWLDRDIRKFEHYRDNLAAIRRGDWKVEDSLLHRDNGSTIFFPHQLGNIPGATWSGQLNLKWSQGFGPFAYLAGPAGASLSLHISGICSFLVGGGLAGGGLAGARVTIQDTRSGFRAAPDLPAGSEPLNIAVPGGPISRTITVDLAEGAVFYGLQTNDPQMIDTTWKFDWSQLPEPA